MHRPKSEKSKNLPRGLSVRKKSICESESFFTLPHHTGSHFLQLLYPGPFLRKSRHFWLIFRFLAKKCIFFEKMVWGEFGGRSSCNQQLKRQKTFTFRYLVVSER